MWSIVIYGQSFRHQYNCGLRYQLLYLLLYFVYIVMLFMNLFCILFARIVQIMQQYLHMLNFELFIFKLIEFSRLDQ